MPAIEKYRSLLSLTCNAHGLSSQRASHYSGNFGFNNLSISIEKHVGDADAKQKKAVEAHEALHAVQAFTQQPARELFRATLLLNRYRFLFLGMLIEKNVRIRVGETIFEAAFRSMHELFQPADRQIEDACQTILSCHQPHYGLSVINLIEGSAKAVESLNYGGDVNENMNASPEIYNAAWLAYQNKGGKDVRVFSLLATAALRYGTIDPLFADTYPHPTEIYNYLINFAQHFESIVSGVDSEIPDYSGFIPPGEYDEFGPIRFGKPVEFLEDSPPLKTKDHFFPDEMFEEHIERALDEYKSMDRQQIVLEDRLFGVSMAIADAMEVAYVRVADPMSVAKLSERKLTLDLVQQEVNKLLPGLFIEEVSIRALVDPNFQQKVANVFKEAIAPLNVKPWSNDDKEMPVELLSHFYELAESVDWVSVGEKAVRSGNMAIFEEIMPRCCSAHHGQLRTLDEICSCENEGGINRDFGELFAVDFADFMKG